MQQKIERWQSVSRSIIFDPWETALSQNRQMQRNYKKEQIQRIRSIRMDLPKRKKRFGRSIKNRCPGYLQAKAKQLFESTGGMYVEVPILYRASQYDHTSDTYIPKKLSQRMYHLADGTKVQRDWYSSYLLYCINKTYTQINKLKCRSNFATMYQKEKNMIEEIIRSGKKIMNSGIRTV